MKVKPLILLMTLTVSSIATVEVDARENYRCLEIHTAINSRTGERSSMKIVDEVLVPSLCPEPGPTITKAADAAKFSLHMQGKEEPHDLSCSHEVKAKPMPFH